MKGNFMRFLEDKHYNLYVEVSGELWLFFDGAAADGQGMYVHPRTVTEGDALSKELKAVSSTGIIEVLADLAELTRHTEAYRRIVDIVRKEQGV